LRNAPLLVQFGYYTTAFGALTYLFAVPGSSRSVVSAAIGGLLFGTWMTVRSARQRTSDRERGRASAQQATMDTLRTRQPPNDPAVRDRLVRYLAYERATLSRTRHWFPAFVAFLTVLTLAAARQDRVWLVFAAVYVVVFVRWLRHARTTSKQLTDVERLLDQAGSRTSG
jgi:Flp pilus assembly protein TadB